MGEDTGPGRPVVTASGDPERIEREIAQTREELGDTVEALAEKTDVKGQAKRKVEKTKATIAEKKEQLSGTAEQVSPDGVATAATKAAGKARENPVPLAAAGAFLAGFLAGRITKR